MSHIERIKIRIEVGASSSEAETVIKTTNSWENLTDAQIKEKVGQLYRDQLSAILKARRAVSSR